MSLRILLIAIFVGALANAVAQQEDDHSIPHNPPICATLVSPDGKLVAIARSPIPETSIPDYHDADGTLLFIRGPNRGDKIIAHRFFGGRFISKMIWSPDSQFLALCSESAGGHSPWHFKSYFWSRDDQKFRSVDFLTGPVVSDELTIAPPHFLTVQIAPAAPEGGLDTEHPAQKKVDLAELRRKTPQLRPSPWP